jgi:hypothetical protein
MTLRQLTRACAIAAGLLGALTPTWGLAQQAVSGLSAVQVFEVAARAEQAGDAATALAVYEALARDPDGDVRAEARFRQARLLAEQRRYTEAAVALRAILDEKPDAQRVRLELANVMALMGDERGAARLLRQVQAGALPPEVALAVDQFSNALRSRKPYGASLELALAPDSNINRATSASTLDTVIAPLELSPDAQQQSGVGARIGGQAYVRSPLSPSVHLSLRVSGQANLYSSSAFNDTVGSWQMGVEKTGAKTRWSPTLGQSYRWYGGALYAVTDTASLNWRRALGQRAQIEADIAVGSNQYKLNSLQDGELYDVSVSYERALSATSGGSISLSAQRQTAEDPGYATRSGGLGVVYWREVGRTTVFLSGNARGLTGDARLGLFTDRREETFLRASAGATFRYVRIKGFSPLVRVSHERNKSTVGLYDYNRNSVEFGLTRAF